MPEERIIWTDAWVGLFGILALLQPGRIECDCLVTWQAINVDLLRFKLAPVPPSLSRPIKNTRQASTARAAFTKFNRAVPNSPWAVPTASPHEPSVSRHARRTVYLGGKRRKATNTSAAASNWNPILFAIPADLPSQTHEPSALASGSNVLDPSTILDDQGTASMFPPVHFDSPIFESLVDAGISPSTPDPLLQGPYRKKKHASNKAASKANEAAWLRKRQRSQMRLLEEQQRKAVVVRMADKVEGLKAAQSGFSGPPEGWEQTDKHLTPPRLSITLQSLLPVEYEYEPLPNSCRPWLTGIIPTSPSNRAPTLVVDREHRLVILRSFRDSRMMDEWMEGNVRPTSFRFNQANGNNNNIPFKTAFTVDYQTEIDGLIASSEFQLICEVLTKLLDQYFPVIAAKYRAADEFWRSKTNNQVTVQFSLFFCVAINATVKSPVKTVPHRDFKNVAIGVCAIFVLGFFDDGETAWLVNFEAGIVIQLPTGVFLLYPSALITHFNVNKNRFMRRVVADQGAASMFPPVHFDSPIFESLVDAGISPSTPDAPSTSPPNSTSAGKEQGPSKLRKESPYRKKKRTSNKAASKANEAARLRKRQRSQMRLLEEQQHKAVIVRMADKVEGLKAAQSGFSGPPEGWEQTDKRLTPPRLSITLQSLLPIEYEYEPLPNSCRPWLTGIIPTSPSNRAPTLIVDCEHRLVILRSFRDSHMMDKWMVSWLRVLDHFAAQTKITEPAEVLTKLLDQYFPAIAAKYRAADRFWWSETSNRVTLQFSLFFCVAINATVKSPVKTVPHRDFKNVAIGVCAIFVLGFFDDGETTWLVNFEASIIIQLPTGVFLLYPSALIMHFNVNKNSTSIYLVDKEKLTDTMPSEFFSNEHPLKFVCTQKGEIPNALNSVPLCSINPGRASLVFFNPASFFYPLTTGFTTLEEARAAGLSGELDFSEEARSSFNKVS
ncbi:hypothetical protein BS47DRAFT_1393708 [Hydnum rufescens UP504]|uniref:BZIP domain-containing protein n=1 Tax=Hydnum rufescens UP504 TaxID=1448309 RepID=A0A9P6DVS1_9AGAM|nr:hypothetical protein BS47DRAFT_1393708 [Hydnum rufescens UP504]